MYELLNDPDNTEDDPPLWICRMEQLHQDMAAIQEEIKQIQDECKHPSRHRTQSPPISVGDNRVTMNHCGLCGKHWNVEVSNV